MATNYEMRGHNLPDIGKVVEWAKNSGHFHENADDCSNACCLKSTDGKTFLWMWWNGKTIGFTRYGIQPDVELLIEEIEQQFNVWLVSEHDDDYDVSDDLSKSKLLLELLKWADSESGREFRASLAHSGEPSPVTAEDVLALLKPDERSRLREMLGLVDTKFTS